MNAVRQSLGAAISDLLFPAAVVGAPALVVVLFPREDPPRKTHAFAAESGEEESEAGPQTGPQAEPGA